MTQQKGNPKVKVNALHVRHGLCKQYGFCTAGFVKPFILSSSYRLEQERTNCT